MRRIGLLGGMSWHSTAVYYRLLNEAVQRRLGGQHSAAILLNSLDFAEIAELQTAGAWGDAARVLGDAARALERAGAELLLLCTNTMHRVAQQVEEAVPIPFLHIVDPLGERIREAGLGTIGLLGTRFTMEQGFLQQRLRARHNVTTIVPPKPDRDVVHRVIYDELCNGEVRDGSREACRRVIDALVARGAEGVILGCTELSLILQPRDVLVPVFDTTLLHAERAVDMALTPSW